MNNNISSLNKNYLEFGNIKIDKSLGVLATTQCNAKCSICCMSQYLTQNKRISVNTFEDIANQAVAIGFKQVSFSGGEVTLHRKLLMSLAKICYEKNLIFTISTNGFLGKNPEGCYKLFSDLKSYGLKKIQFSHDEFHAEYINTNYFLSALEVARKLDIEYKIHWTYKHTGIRSAQLLPKEIYETSTISENPIADAGNTRSLPDSYFSESKEAINYFCKGPYSIVLDPNGKVFPCCSVLGFSEYLNIGNYTNEKLESIIENLFSNEILFYIKTFGFKDLVNDLNLDSMIPKVRTSSCCDYCFLLFNNYSLLMKARAYISFKMEIYACEIVDNICTSS